MVDRLGNDHRSFVSKALSLLSALRGKLPVSLTTCQDALCIALSVSP
jgi:hypothetical protein